MPPLSGSLTTVKLDHLKSDVAAMMYSGKVGTPIKTMPCTLHKGPKTSAQLAQPKLLAGLAMRKSK